MTASSFAVMGVQLGYAAITSRLLPPSAFGAYAVALSGVGFIGMLGGSSLGQAAARRDHDSVHLDRSLVTLALIVGCPTALLAMLLAPLWGRVWGVPESTQVTQVLALGIPLSALSAVLAGILRRGGRTSAVAGRTGLGQLVGMGVGLTAVLCIGTAWSLGVASVAGLLVTTALFSAALPRDRLKPARPTTASLEDARFGMKTAGMNLLRHSTNLVPVWAIGRFAGSGTLGQYNRATTFLTMPIESLHRSFSFALFPELRPNGSASMSDRALTDIFILMTWPTVFIGGLGYLAAEPFIVVILGPEWEGAASIAGAAVLLGVLPILGAPLASSLEARGDFRLTLLGWLCGSVAIALGAYGTFVTRDIRPAMLGLLTGAAIRLMYYLAVLGTSGRVSLPRVLAGAWPIIAIQIGTTALLLWPRSALSEEPILFLVVLILVGLLELALIWRVRNRTHFWRVGRDRGLPGFGGSA